LTQEIAHILVSLHIDSYDEELINDLMTEPSLYTDRNDSLGIDGGGELITVVVGLPKVTTREPSFWSDA